MTLNLWNAILAGKYDLANKMISRDKNVNKTLKTRYDPVTTLLHFAMARKRDIQCIYVLANHGANFIAPDSKNRIALHWAAAFGVRADVIEVLINEGSDVDARDDDQMTPLHYAARNNCIESAEKLIARGASLEAIDIKGQSILHLAVVEDKVEAVKMLISHKVNIDTKDNQGYTPLLRYFSEHRKGEDKTEMIQLLLDNGADLNAKTHKGKFSLYYAVNFNRLDSLHLLLKRGARVTDALIHETALHVACKNGLAKVTALLLKFGADLNARNQNGKTPFELLPNKPSSEAIAKIIIRETIKREALGQSLCEEYQKMVQSRETYLRFEKKCLEEVNRMQSQKIDIEDCAISFFNILSIDEEKLTALARNETIVTAFESSGYVASFSIYAGELTTKFEMAKKRANLPAPIVRKIEAYVKYGYMIENEL